MTIGNKRYLLIRYRLPPYQDISILPHPVNVLTNWLPFRSSSLSVKFFSAISKTFTFSSKAKGDEFFRKLVFNFGQIIGKSDVRTLSRTVALKTPLQIYAAGPIYQAYAGLGFTELLPDFDALSDTGDGNITVVTNHLVSAEGKKDLQNVVFLGLMEFILQRWHGRPQERCTRILAVIC